MPRYFIDMVEQGSLVIGDESVEFASLDDAWKDAQRAAREMLAAAAREGRNVLDDEIILRDANAGPSRKLRLRDVLC